MFVNELKLHLRAFISVDSLILRNEIEEFLTNKLLI